VGGLGSGRPSGSGRDTVEACRSLDVNRLHREGCLPPAGRAAGNGGVTASEGFVGHAKRPECVQAGRAPVGSSLSGSEMAQDTAKPITPATLVRGIPRGYLASVNCADLHL